MPLDTSVADVLRRARAIIDSPEKWGKGNRGHFPQKGTCIVGALYGALGETSETLYLGEAVQWPAFARAYDALKEIVGGVPATWQDESERTHAEVMAAFDRAIELAEAEG